ncbi:ParB/RepB/Spo0J family partition protein [Haematomicrobium sanguinis]|uniref:ParB/RepB/Spo0J family partition protein n=1 Tax=Haematomicrobium sanguinis TaxID=479106 RepID=UPI00068A54CC|nr:ParB/RepB/Spo0J family partition protein [Haematomicrobium sanguinis]
MAEKKKRGLGRGIAALIPSEEPTQSLDSTEESEAAPRTTSRRSASRPVDVFFSGSSSDDDSSEVAVKSGPGSKGSTGSGSQRSGNARSTKAKAEAGSTKGASKSTAEGSTNLDSGLVPVPGASFAEVSVTDIVPNRKQPRSVFDEEAMAELVHSVKEIGVLQPIVVRPLDQPVEGKNFELIMGERRWRATQQAGLSSVPAIVRTTSDDDLLRDALLENLHRSQLNPLEEGAAYQQLLDDFGISHEVLADRIGRSRSQVSNTLRLLKLPPLVQKRVAAGVISAGHARALLGLSSPALMEELAQRIVAEGLSVRSTEEIVATSMGESRKQKRSMPRAGARHERLDYLEQSLGDKFETSVTITLGAKKGKVTIDFASVDDLNRIVDIINADG